MTTEALSATAAEMRGELARIMEFWSVRMRDDERGGYYGEMRKDGTIVADAEKGCILAGRMLYAFAAAARHCQHPDWHRAADRAYQYLSDHFHDKQNGGFFWALNADGSPKDTKKQAYAQGFVIYGLAEYCLLQPNDEALKLAQETYHLMERHFRDRDKGGYIEALAADWTPLADVRLSDKDMNTPKSMNSHLHIIEPYANLFRVWPNDELKESIQHCLDIFRNRIIDPKTGRFNLFFDMEWNVLSHIDSYGHDIEGAWLLMEAAEVIGDERQAEQLKPICKHLVDLTLAEGWDGESIYNEKHDGHLDPDKHWWPQAEAMVGLTDTWRLTGESAYLDKMTRVWHFVQNHLIDPASGEWFWRVDKSNANVYDDPLAGFWKCPYHNTRSLIEVLNRIEPQL